MLVVCKIGSLNTLTIGKKYEVLQVKVWNQLTKSSFETEKVTEYMILSDNGTKYYFSKFKFKTLQEDRILKLKKI